MARYVALPALAAGLTLALSGASASAQGRPPASHVDGDDIEATIRRSIAGNRLDTKVAEQSVKGGVLRVGVVHRRAPEPRALLHQELTEVYTIVEGSGTLITGGTFQEATAVADPPNLGNTPTFYVNQQGGVTQRVKPRDVVIIPAGTPHRFLALDGPITYVIHRFEPAQDR